ncbi:MAG TPA: DNA repair protein RadC [Anaerolineaceae bacterium]|nr:DNA repair protein RadC [Anaerolineaceae bacterium]
MESGFLEEGHLPELALLFFLRYSISNQNHLCCTREDQVMREDRPAYRITDLDIGERPRERLERLGANALSTAELLAILLRTGLEGENAVQMASRLLNDMGGLNGLQRASFEDLRQQHGLGTAKAAQIKAAIELGRRLAVSTNDERPLIQSPEAAADQVLYEMSGLAEEQLWVLVLDNKNRLIHVDRRYKGTANSSQVRVGELFEEAIRRKALSIILVHNHPSGDLTPSQEDLTLTRAVLEAGKLLDISLLDHLIVGGMRFLSLKKEKYMS